MKKCLWHGMTLKFNTVIMSFEEHSTDILVARSGTSLLPGLLRFTQFHKAVDSIQRMPPKFSLMRD